MNWTKNSILLSASQELRLKINHAFHGKDHDFSGRNCLPVNRLFIAADNSGTISYGEQKVKLSKGTITFIPINLEISYNFTHGALVAYHFNVELFPGIDVFENEKTCKQDLNPELCNSSYLAANDCSTLSNAFSLQGDLLQLISFFCTKDTDYLSKQLTLRIKYQELLSIIEQNLDAQMSIASLSYTLKTSRDQLSKSFNRDMGIPLKKFLNNRLMQKATNALREGLNVKQVASKLNFSSEFYFSIFFKKMCGIAPSRYLATYSI